MRDYIKHYRTNSHLIQVFLDIFLINMVYIVKIVLKLEWTKYFSFWKQLKVLQILFY